MPAVAKPAPDQPKPKKKKKIRKIKPRVLKLKGWFKTPEDWAKFDAWVKVNALPRQLPEPEPIIRKAVKLRRLKKRLKVLSKPTIRPITQCVERVMTRDIRCAKTTKRTKELAFPKLRMPPDCQDLGIVKKAALKYKVTDTIQYLSQPKIRPIPSCRSLGKVSKSALKRKTTSDRLDELARPAKRRRLNDECMYDDFRCSGEGQLSEWMEFLAIPSYRRLVGQNSEKAQLWREQIVSELEPRGKQAYEEQMRKREEDKKRELQKHCEDEIHRAEELRRQYDLERLEFERQNPPKIRLICQPSEEEQPKPENDVIEECEDEDEESIDDFQDALKECGGRYSRSTMICKSRDENVDEMLARLKRKMEKDKWRYESLGICVEYPRIITEAAKNHEASPLTKKLAIPKKNRGDTCRDPYVISETAKSAQASAWVENLAKPKHHAEPVTRSEPREKDEFGMPIYLKPPFGKVLPPRVPYTEAECKTEEQKEEERKQKEEEKKKVKIPIDKIAYEPTIDPMFDPRAAKRQAKERERAAREAAEEEKKKRAEEEEGEDTEDTPVDDATTIADVQDEETEE